MPAHHSRKSSGGAPQHHTQRRNSQSQATTPKPTHLRSNTAPEPPPLLRVPSAPAATARRPPASHSAHGIDNSRGPPVTLVTRSRSTQNAADFAYAQQQQLLQLQSGLVSPTSSHHSTRRRGDDDSVTSSEAPRPQSQQTTPRQLPIASAIPTPSLSRPPPGRRNSTSTSRPPARRMASSTDESSEYDSGPRSRMEDYHAAHSGRGPPAPVTPGTDTEKEDLFLNIAADTAPKQQRPSEVTTRVERLKSRVARVNSSRQSLPSALHSPSPVQSNSTATPTTSRIPVEPRSSALRRSSFLPTPSRAYERSPNSPAPDAAPRTRDLSHKASFTSTRRDAELSPRDFLAQFSATRRSSQSDVQHTPPSRTPVQPYRPSNLSHEPRTPHVDTSFEAGSRADGTESHGSTGPAASVWDELDELKSRIRKIEMGGKIPSTSGAIVSQASQASAERPRTANTSATTVSSSPNQQRKSNLSPSESSVSTQAPPSANRTHPLLRDALSKARQHVSPAVYRSLEATAQEALALAEMSGSGGPQGTLHSASSIINGSVVSDRQVRRKADNLCRSLTELCIAVCDTKTGLSSPAFRSTQATISRRPSVQINGDSPTIRQSIEPESNTMNGVSPSRALSRIEARRTSMLIADSNGSQRGNSQEPYDDRQTPSRLQRAGTSLHRTRESVDEDEEDPIFRAPSRAMTSVDFRARQTDNNRFSGGRQYTSREQMPDLQPSPALQSSASLRRPSISSTPSNERSSLLFRDQSRYGHNLGREGSPVIYDKPMSGGLRARAQLSVARNPNNRHSVGGISDIGRNVNLGRRLRGNSTGE
ncbi:hypothetical protein CFE70_002480 [Pyrenophora teres f. teres 0-1]|uniref:Uncharacterized protein n=2 Tax=Pyrenophora teres f. teres TaxID=97479 RepID=E3RTP2_PYRTT|nr:hypothetical protein PTT_12396 [Pyrenophora teres f. teres 0-1]KAE8843038.1 hypothetical protein HRS9139_02335 [Pyrenophora teres f. teres]KAE8849905.1 hypothetical protein PTNB85_00321 [Pyrenophora teres f. teres]KAE8852070.1 hypothetical protein HRS9122_02357 [Pyrenophora teres f. teres]KAE8870740.1 hypothetical protein PTNB29_01084 [Pyrenophora teres f. teres]